MLERARSLLFVPGDQPDRVRKALASGADGVIIDLEDALSPENRVIARTYLKDLQEQSLLPDSSILIVRVNSFGTPDFPLDLTAVLQAGVGAIMVPKFVAGEIARQLEAEIEKAENGAGCTAPLLIIALIETAAGVLSLLNSSFLPQRTLRLAFGAADYCADLGISPSDQSAPLDLAHSALVLASAAAGLAPPLDSPYFSLDNDVGAQQSAQSARQKGYGGKLAIHPKQLPVIHESFQWSEAQLHWADEVLTAWQSPTRAGAGAIVVDGQLIDEAMVRRARAISPDGAAPK